MSSKLRPGADILLRNPGLVENSPDAEHCVHACFQMIFRTKIGAAVPSFDELDEIMEKRPGKYTWEYGLLADMPRKGFDTKIIWTLDLAGLANDPKTALRAHYGDAVGQAFIDNSDLGVVQDQAQRLLSSSADIETRSPAQDDIVHMLDNGYYITVTINQRVLQADPGYAAHSILIYGAGDHGVIVQNPGPPATEASRIPWELFEKAWAYPDAAARNVMALRPRQKGETQ